jgi:predicted kinase
MKVIILRGLPGSGKSHYISALNNVRVVSADHYFMKDGQYKFDPSRLSEAHNDCFRKFMEEVFVSNADGISDVAVDNTNISLMEMAPYVAYARAMDVEVEIVRISCDVETCAKRNVHGVPEEAIRSMARRAENVPPFWPKEKVVQGD